MTGAGIEEAALRALTTVRQVMPSRLRHRLDAVEFTAVRRPGDGPGTPVSPDVVGPTELTQAFAKLAVRNAMTAR